MPYSFMDHTADFGIRVWGADAETLFENAAGALWELIAGPELVKKTVALDLEISGMDYADLMFNWLRELLYLWTGKAWIGGAAAVREISENHLAARVWGEHFDSGRHLLVNEIKAVTYHQLAVEERSTGGWECRVIFDV